MYPFYLSMSSKTERTTYFNIFIYAINFEHLLILTQIGRYGLLGFWIKNKRLQAVTKNNIKTV